MPNVTQAPGLFTRAIQEIYRERVEVPSFFASFFTETETDAKDVSIEVRRANEKVAVDVIRGTNGNRNQVTRSTFKMFTPPLYHELFDVTTLQVYDRKFGTQETDANTVADIVNEAATEAALMVDKIERAYEVQRAQVFETGIVQLQNSINIDFKRKAASIVDTNAVGGGYWDAGTTNIKQDLVDGAEFLRKTGKAQGGIFNVIMGGEALNAFLSAQETLDQADTRYMKRMDIEMPQNAPNGGVFHGQYSSGSYKFNIWTYPEFRDVAGIPTPYWPSKKVLMLPVGGTRFSMNFAGTPAIFQTQSELFPRMVLPMRGKFNVYNFVDPQRFSHDMGVMSAAIAVPVSIDMIYTMTVLA